MEISTRQTGGENAGHRQEMSRTKEPMLSSKLPTYKWAATQSYNENTTLY